MHVDIFKCINFNAHSVYTPAYIPQIFQFRFSASEEFSALAQSSESMSYRMT